MKLTLTSNIQDSVQSALAHPDFSVVYREEAEKIVDQDLKEAYPVSVELLQHVSKCIDGVYLHELLKGSGVYIEPKEEKPKNPEFEAYMAKLRAQQAEKEYNNMVSSVVTSEDQKFNLGIQPDELREVKSHIATIFNILFSIVAVYVAVYKASKSIVHDVGLQVLMGLGGALFIGAVEVILYSKYAYMATTEKKKPTKKIATL